jgi:hypothetical protein
VKRAYVHNDITTFGNIHCVNRVVALLEVLISLSCWRFDRSDRCVCYCSRIDNKAGTSWLICSLSGYLGKRMGKRAREKQ